eukprot:CAMPEP_0116846566 /NCGR_PEP_ID=MMETSP0418-20121206/13906_1 /TAXON_ID=1158023 /ORGANISM="Astrosyne radiata, Strain 13vi08-1A" /LENGTH=242 /DNA_ID=CAMNT_0004477827 /DNA_START=69 /DNA_END=797 /DNA_ORIENTATION=-
MAISVNGVPKCQAASEADVNRFKSALKGKVDAYLARVCSKSKEAKWAPEFPNGPACYASGDFSLYFSGVGTEEPCTADGIVETRKLGTLTTKWFFDSMWTSSQVSGICTPPCNPDNLDQRKLQQYLNEAPRRKMTQEELSLIAQAFVDGEKMYVLSIPERFIRWGTVQNDREFFKGMECMCVAVSGTNGEILTQVYPEWGPKVQGADCTGDSPDSAICMQCNTICPTEIPDFDPVDNANVGP